MTMPPGHFRLLSRRILGMCSELKLKTEITTPIFLHRFATVRLQSVVRQSYTYNGQCDVMRAPTHKLLPISPTAIDFGLSLQPFFNLDISSPQFTNRHNGWSIAAAVPLAHKPVHQYSLRIMQPPAVGIYDIFAKTKNRHSRIRMGRLRRRPHHFSIKSNTSRHLAPLTLCLHAIVSFHRGGHARIPGGN